MLIEMRTSNSDDQRLTLAIKTGELILLAADSDSSANNAVLSK